MNQYSSMPTLRARCTVTENDRHASRVRRTRELLLGTMYQLALEKHYCDITVQDLLDRSGIARSTFYAHFRDKEDLLFAGYGIMGKPAVTIAPFSGGSKVMLDVCSWLFVATEQHAALTTSLMNGASRDIVHAQLENLLIIQVRDHLKRYCTYQADDAHCEIAVRSLVGGLLALWLWWVRHDYPCAHQDICASFNTLMTEGVWPQLT